MQLKIKITILFCLVLSVWASAQVPVWENQNFKQQSVLVISDSIDLHSKFILPEKLLIQDENGDLIPELFYKIDYTNGILILDKSLIGQKITVNYFVHPDLQKENIFSKDTAIIREPAEESRYFSLGKQKLEVKKPFDGLNSRGSLLRGVRFGNNQGASVQSSLDLQLTGQLTEEIGINAVISDNNAPIEAEGFTQTFQEFDRIFVEIFNKNSKVRAGHIDLIQESDFFANFHQKVTGLQFMTQLNHSEDSRTRISVTGSTARGEFASKSIIGQNGNQGPYKLTGNNNEVYIVLVSGSERVFIDGILLNRGEDKDYIINYVTGELTFTSNRLISDESRIRVEYLYANRAYTQFLVYGGVEHESGRFSIAGHFYSNGDSKNNPLTDNLSDQDKQILAAAGNNTDEMYNTTAIPAEFDPAKILYRKTTLDGVEIFEFSEDPNEELYQVSFTYIGPNLGNYEPTNMEVNGRIFEYMPPIDGIKQGSYEPIRQLIPPKRLQVYTLNSAYKFKNGGVLGVDLGMSFQDLNLFSSKDDGQNMGYAARMYGDKSFDFKSWKLTPHFEISRIQKNFKLIERLRAIEFDRDFNLEEEVSNIDQTYMVLGLDTSYKDSLKLNYNLHYLQNKGHYEGVKNELNLNYLTKKNFANGHLAILNTKKENLANPMLESDKSRFIQYNTIAKRKIKKSFWVGATFFGEDNEIEDRQNVPDGDHLSELSFVWNELRAMTGIGDTAKVFAEMAYYTRRDDSVRLGKMENLSRSNGLMLSSRLINKASHRLETNFHYRRVKYDFGRSDRENYITGNIKWHRSLFRNGLVINSFYELGSGVEPQRKFEYVRVTDGMGIYQWTDYNGDGLEQLDEFEVADFQDHANYIRVYTSTVEFIKTNKNNFTFSIRIKPRELLNAQNKFLGRWMLQASLQTANSLLREGQTLEWNPFVNSDNLLSKTKSLRGVLNFNQGGNYKWMAAYTYSDQQNQHFVFTGDESRSTRSHLLNLKYRPWKLFNFLTEIENYKTKSYSEMFSSLRFTLDGWRLKPQIRYQVEAKFSAAINYSYQRIKNISGLEKLNQSDLGTELQWNDGKKSSLLGTFNYIKNDFTGNSQSVIGNQMMNGFKPGDNFVWQILFQRDLNSFLSINIGYDGRKTEETKAIHAGSVRLQARF